jgi:hypothetical protein
MEKFSALSPQRLLFDLASRLGSLEGYLYAEEKVGKKYLPNWLRNIESAYASLTEDVQKEILSDYLALLHKAHNLIRQAYGHQDPNPDYSQHNVQGASLCGRGQWGCTLKRTADCVSAATIEDKHISVPSTHKSA